jgi:hypothetical protein
VRQPPVWWEGGIGGCTRIKQQAATPTSGCSSLRLLQALHSHSSSPSVAFHFWHERATNETAEHWSCIVWYTASGLAGSGRRWQVLAPADSRPHAAPPPTIPPPLPAQHPSSQLACVLHVRHVPLCPPRHDITTCVMVPLLTVCVVSDLSARYRCTNHSGQRLRPPAAAAAAVAWCESSSAAVYPCSCQAL